MIEGVNASVASASLLRPVSEQVVASRSYAANPTQVQQLPQAPYVSPYISINYVADKAVLQFRDSESGEVVQQIPSETQLKAYRRAAAQQPLIFEPKADRAEERVETVKSAAVPTPKVEVKVDAPVPTDSSDTVSTTESEPSPIDTSV